MKCSCYYEIKIPTTRPTRCECWGTKEREACSCGGDRNKCDFYEDVRARAGGELTLEQLRYEANEREFGVHIWIKDLVTGSVMAGLTDVHSHYGICGIWCCSVPEEQFHEEDYGNKWVAYLEKPEE